MLATIEDFSLEEHVVLKLAAQNSDTSLSQKVERKGNFDIF